MRRAGAFRDIPPPLEMMCLRVLWSLEEANVRAVQEQLAETRSLAYTTVMTALDRLARRGLISRRKVGRAFLYVPIESRDVVQRRALDEFLAGYFDGSEQQLLEFLRKPAVPDDARPEVGLDTTLL
jgi:BlaI family transcriptional regulator, penicillinase repressor